jgi:hypothetical protein
VLLYYAALSLATAEVLYKQTGESSLDRARAEHRHHGLIFRVSRKPDGPVSEAARSLVAFPLIDRDVRRGTFELWHRSARRPPMVGRSAHNFVNNTRHISYASLLSTQDVRLPLLPAEGMNLTDILMLVPGLREQARWWGLPPVLCRGEVGRTTYEGTDQVDLTYVIHPSDPQALSKVTQGITMSPWLVDRVQISESPGALRVSLTETAEIRPYHFEWPNGINLNAKEAIFFPGEPPVNEFGLFYLGLFITGNFARYFPDHWIKLIEAAHPLSHAIDSFVTLAAERLPILTFCELSETVWLQNVSLT